MPIFLPSRAVDTLGDGFMAVCGCDPANFEDQASRLLGYAKAILQEVADQDTRFRRADPASLLISSAARPPLRVRVGVHCGPAIAASLGSRNVKLSFFGDTVNIASRRASPTTDALC